MPAKRGGDRLSDSKPLLPDLFDGFDFGRPSMVQVIVGVQFVGL